MATSWEGRSKATPLGFKIFIALLKAGGLPAAYQLLPLVTAWYRWFMPSATRPLRYLYEQRMGYSYSQSKKLIRQNLLLFGQSLLDKIAIISNIPNKLHVEHENFEAIEQMRNRGQGGILLSAHLGNWEAAGHMLKRYNLPVNILMYDGEAQNIKNTMKETNDKRSFNIISISEDGSHIYEIKAALARNELICINADRFREGNRTFTVKFMGADAQFPAGPFILASKLQTPVSFTFALKQDRYTYLYKAYPANSYSSTKNEGAMQMLQDFVMALENELKRHPDQWFNYYPFWNEQHT